MTGFGKAQKRSLNFDVCIEIKSVNNRFKDLRFKMPSSLSSTENEMKARLSSIFSRGTFDIYVNVKYPEGKNKFDELDLNKINQFLKKISPVFDHTETEINVNPTDFLRSEFYKDQEEDSIQELNLLALEVFNEALTELKKSREQEGSKLKSILLKHLDEYRLNFKIIEKNAEYKGIVNIEASRLLSEVVFYLEKMDIHEEINRVYAHLEKFENLLKSNIEVGRQIDFFIQELNRETNTMGSKSSVGEISSAVIQMKVQLEKMREQGLNIE
jgi:uncharacterized protein (TIGR00255 family)